jgi:hypothetical protein
VCVDSTTKIHVGSCCVVSKVIVDVDSDVTAKGASHFLEASTYLFLGLWSVSRISISLEDRRPKLLETGAVGRVQGYKRGVGHRTNIHFYSKYGSSSSTAMPGNPGF